MRFVQGQLEAQDVRVAVSIEAIVQSVAEPRGPGMQRAQTAGLWRSISASLREVLLRRSDGNGKISPQLAISAIAEFEANADLDLPEGSEGYLPRTAPT